MTGKGRGRVKRRSPPSLGNILSLSGPQHGENFGYTILRAIGLLVFVGVKTFHTASVGFRTFGSPMTPGGNSIVPLSAALIRSVDPMPGPATRGDEFFYFPFAASVRELR